MKRVWHPGSVRVRLTLWYAGTFAVVLTLYASGVFVFLRHSLFTELDGRLHEDFEVAEQMLERTVDGGIGWRARDHHEEENSGDDGWLEVWSPEGKLLYRRESIEREGRKFLFSVASPGQRGYQSISLPNNIHVRALS